MRNPFLPMNLINYVGSYEDMKEAAKQLAAFYEFCLRNAKEK